MACRLEFPKSEKRELDHQLAHAGVAGYSSQITGICHHAFPRTVPTRPGKGQHKLLISTGTRLSREPPIVKLDGEKRLALHVESLAAGDGSL